MGVDCVHYMCVLDLGFCHVIYTGCKERGLFLTLVLPASVAFARVLYPC